jgi:hypothetical protein
LSNQTLLWSSVVLAWASTLFLKKEEMRRYMPAALFCMVVFTFILEAGITLHWWVVTETAFPLVNMPIFVYGAYLVGTIWIFKYTYGRFWIFLATNIILDFILIFFILDWLVQRGVCIFYISYFQVLLITTLLAVLIYGYQMWQEGEALLKTTPSIQPAASKPLNEDLVDKPDKQ